MTEIKTISIRAYADLLGVSEKAVRNAIKSKKIVAGVRYVSKVKSGKNVQVPEIIQDAADREWGFLHQTSKAKPGQTNENVINKLDAEIEDPENADEVINSDDSDLLDEDVVSIKIHAGLSYREATRRREILSLAMERRKLQELEGSLIRKDLVEKTLFAMGVELKKSLLNIPARIISEIRSAANDVEAQNMMTIELTQTLSQFSNLQEIKF